ncbi:MAG: cation acetate symporter [Candidatus Brocadiia bacterium]
MLNYPLVFGFIVFFVAVTIVITWLTQKSTKTTKDFYAAGRSTPWVTTGLALVGSYLSAASFLGCAGDIAIFGVDRIWLAIGFFGGYMAVLLLIAGPLRNVGSYTVADALHRRFPDNKIKLVVMIATVVISTFYLVPQMLGAGLLFEMIVGWNFILVTVGLGILMSIYIIFGGMKGTLYNQLVQAVFLFAAMVVITVLGLIIYFDGSIFKLFEVLSNVVPPGLAGKDPAVAAAVAAAPNAQAAVQIAREMMPNAPTAMTIGIQTPDMLSQISTVLALVFGTAGLPHILIMFYTVPSAKAAKKSVTLCIVSLGIFYLCTIFLGFLLMPEVYQQLVAWIAAGKAGIAKNMAVLEISGNIGGQVLMAVGAAGAVAAILSTAAGLMITVASTISHDLYKVYINKDASEKQEINIARVTTLVMAGVSVVLAVLLKSENVAWLVTLAFGIAASAIFPVMLLSLWWKGLTRQGAIAGIVTGLVVSSFFIVLLLSGVPKFMGLSTAGGPGVFGVTAAFAVLFIVSKMTRDYGPQVDEFMAIAHKTEEN